MEAPEEEILQSLVQTHFGGKGKDAGTSPTTAAGGKTSLGTTAKDSSPVGSGNTDSTGKTAAPAPVPNTSPGTSIPGDRRNGAVANIPPAPGDRATSHIRNSPQSAVINTTSVNISNISQNINQPNINNKNRRINLVRNMNNLGSPTIGLGGATSAINLAGKIMDGMLADGGLSSINDRPRKTQGRHRQNHTAKAVNKGEINRPSAGEMVEKANGGALNFSEKNSNTHHVLQKRKEKRNELHKQQPITLRSL
ncbi:MAG: hypothetical protein LBB13_02580 [Rickettsiales bacterium]|nr:hypothetical protein [Rickettsiales bacterium]